MCGRPAQVSSASERPKGGAADHGEPPHGMHPHRVSASLSEKEGSVVTAANHCFGHQRESTRGILIGGEAVLRSARAGAGAGGLWGRAGVHAQKPFAKALRISPSERATPPSLLNLKLVPRTPAPGPGHFINYGLIVQMRTRAAHAAESFAEERSLLFCRVQPWPISPHATKGGHDGERGASHRGPGRADDQVWG